MNLFIIKKVLSSWGRRGRIGSTMVAILATLVISSTVGAQPVNTDESFEAPLPAEKTVLIPIEGMSCGACVARIKKTLKAIDGVTDVAVNLEHRNARVKYIETKTSPNQLVVAINNLGYKAGAPAIR